ncbi:MAG: Smr/MutS family protein [Holosporaceae bacterium]|jgi:DNA-nicking Smr family endonuclease|nr:Smr/MutS family protein [Holosporaceae bacterium]
MKDLITNVKPITARDTITKTQKMKSGFTQKSVNSESFCPKENQLNVMSRKLHRKFTTEKTIDLHGLTQDEAFNVLLNFFIKCQSENVKRVLVITGGNALKKSVIRSSFQKWIKELFGNYVASYSQANIWHGGQGAFYVILKQIPFGSK